MLRMSCLCVEPRCYCCSTSTELRNGYLLGRDDDDDDDDDDDHGDDDGGHYLHGYNCLP